MRDDCVKKNEMKRGLKRLNECLQGSSCIVRKIEAGHHAELKLMNMGVRNGQIIKIIKASALKGPIVVDSNNSEIAIGHGLSHKILVEDA